MKTLTTRRLFVAVFLLALVILTARNVTDPDSGWHFRTGEYIVTTGTIPHADMFSFTATGQPWVTHEWLAEVMMYLLLSTGGTGALIAFFALVAAAAFALLYWRCPGKPYVAAFVVLLAALAAAPFWGTRPHTLSLLYASACLAILDHYRRSGNARTLWWLIPLMVLWANSHGSFVLEPILIGTYLVGAAGERVLFPHEQAELKLALWPLLRILILCTLAILLNPNGLTLYAYPFQTLGSRAIQTLIQEWQAPDLHAAEIQPFLWLLLATVAGLAWSRRRVNLVDIILFVGLTFAGLRNVRQISIWVLIAAPLLATAVFDLLESLGWKAVPESRPNAKGSLRFLNWALLLLFVLAAILRIATLVQEEPIAESKYFPVAAVNFVRAQRLNGPLFNRYDWGGYVLWQLYPNERVFIDGRSDLYGLTDDSIVRAYLAAYTGQTNWREPLDRYHIRLVIVDPQAALAKLLGEEPQWTRVFSDQQAVVFTRN